MSRSVEHCTPARRRGRGKEDVWMLKMVNVVILMRCVGEVGVDRVEGMVG